MLKQLTAWLLIFSVLSVNYSRLFVFAGFKLNQTYIAAKLCVNRNRPSLHCNGQCYLMKKIRVAENEQRSSEGRAQKDLFQDLYCTLSPVSLSVPAAIHIPPDFMGYDTSQKPSNILLDIFRLPQLG